MYLYFRDAENTVTVDGVKLPLTVNITDAVITPEFEVGLNSQSQDYEEVQVEIDKSSLEKEPTKLSNLKRPCPFCLKKICTSKSTPCKKNIATRMRCVKRNSWLLRNEPNNLVNYEILEYTNITNLFSVVKQDLFWN